MYEAQSEALSSFLKDPKKYYKRWALVYCLKYTQNANITKLSGCIKKGLSKIIMNYHHINVITKILGDEPLNGLKAYMDNNRIFFPIEDNHKDYVNTCFDWIYGEWFDDNLVKIMKQYCQTENFGPETRESQKEMKEEVCSKIR